MEKIKIIENDDRKFEEELGLMLHSYNRKNCEYIMQNSDLVHNKKIIKNFKIYHNDILIGGATGYIEFGWYFLDQLCIDPNYRKKGIGSLIIEKIKNYAKEKNCFGIKLFTWSFQAKEFYEKNGFEVYAELKDFPPGASEYLLKKVL